MSTSITERLANAVPNPKPKPPRTPAQQEAARRNGARSRGPVTAAGKNIIRANALKHGVTAKVIRLRTDYYSAFDPFFASILELFAPANDLEFLAVQEYAWAKWRYRRAIELETLVLNDELDLRRPEINLGVALINSESKTNAFRNAQVYVQRCRREAERALAEFERLARLRDLELIDPELQAELDPELKPAPAPIAATQPKPVPETPPAGFVFSPAPPKPTTPPQRRR